MPAVDGKPQKLPKGVDAQVDIHPQHRELAVLVCTGALRLRKERGLQAVSQPDIARQTDHRPSEVEQGIAQALQLGWLVRRDDHVALTAAGIYVAKEALDLPR
jgi:hypothetical protein